MENPMKAELKLNACIICGREFNPQKIGCGVISGEASRVFTGFASENTYTLIVNSRSRTSCGRQAAINRLIE
jgi:hypothetical protein